MIDCIGRPKEETEKILKEIKAKIEQKAALADYANPGPIENVIYFPVQGDNNMDFKYMNNKDIINVPMTKEEAEVVSRYLLDRRIKLEDCDLKDSYCYPRITTVYYNIIRNLNK